ncbi:MAG: NFACT family protein, partial [Lachnospiraceae bacterium]|nr:NFACT family protein [Lachnospiraceae bacterium]
MAFDGILVHALTAELNSVLRDTRLVKIQEPSPEELLLSFKSRETEARLLLSASASLPFFCLTETKKESPAEAPAFLMLLRKHLSNARFLRAVQPGLERVLFLDFEHLDEMGDLRTVRLVSEVMGKYSNLILVSEDGTILDAIRRVSPLMSSVRSVLPGKPYFIPETQGKTDPLTETKEDFLRRLDPERTALQNLADHYQGMSAASVSEWLLDCGIHPDAHNESEALWDAFSRLCETLREERFTPLMVMKDDKPEGFFVLPVHSYPEEAGYTSKLFRSPSALVDLWYCDKNRTDVLKEDRKELLKAVR